MPGTPSLPGAHRLRSAGEPEGKRPLRLPPKIAALQEQLRQAEAALAERDAALQEALRGQTADPLQEELRAQIWELEQALVQAQEEGSDIRLVDLDAIRADRPLHTHDLHEEQVRVLALDIIQEGGLAQPLLLDRQDRPIAGERRRQALVYLREQHPEDFARLFARGIPIRQRLDIDFDEDLPRALSAMWTAQAQREHGSLEAKRRHFDEAMQILLADQRACWGRGQISQAQREQGLYHAPQRLQHWFSLSRQSISRWLAPYRAAIAAAQGRSFDEPRASAQEERRQSQRQQVARARRSLRVLFEVVESCKLPLSEATRKELLTLFDNP